MLAFCEAVQRGSPVGAHIQPTPGVTPGYGDEVIFADGTFIDGSTLELSADGPLREPFAVYLQGGTHWTHWVLVLRDALRAIAELDGGVITAGATAGATVGATVEAGGDGEASEAVGGEAEAVQEARRYAGRRSLKNS